MRRDPSGPLGRTDLTATDDMWPTLTPDQRAHIGRTILDEWVRTSLGTDRDRKIGDFCDRHDIRHDKPEGDPA